MSENPSKDFSLKCMFVIVIIAVLSGCMPRYITSNPSGASVTLGGRHCGVTPVTVHVGTVHGLATMVLKKEGYKTLTVPVKELVRGTTHFELEGAAPVSFVKMIEPTWASIEIRKEVEYEKAWASLLDLLVKRFDLEVLSKDNGYARTGWLYTWAGGLREDYRVRVTVKFSPDRSKVEIKSEANYRSSRGWIMGSDTALLKTLKTDIMGTVGRATR